MTDVSESQVGGNHYSHFKIQPITYAEENELTPSEFSAVKYISRRRYKNGLEDLKKAVHYLQIMMDQDYDCQMHVSYAGNQHKDDNETGPTKLSEAQETTCQAWEDYHDNRFH